MIRDLLIPTFVALLAPFATPSPAWCGPDMGPGPVFPLTRANWGRHAAGEPQLHAVVETGALGAPAVALEMRRPTPNERRVYLSRGHRLELATLPRDCKDPVIHLDYSSRWGDDSKKAPLSLEPRGFDTRDQATRVRIRPSRDYERDAFFESDPYYASPAAPPSFRIGKAYRNRYAQRSNKLVTFGAADSPGRGALLRACEFAPSLRDCVRLSEDERAALLERQWRERRAEHARAMRCTAVVVAHMGPAENELSVRVVARDREIWGKTIVPVQGGWPRAPFYPLLALTVPADSAILVLQTVYVALWAPILIPMILMR